MDLRHLFLQERLRDGTIGAIEKIDTSVNLADVGTKHFTASRLEELKRLLGMVDVVDESVLHAAASVVSAICCRCRSTEVSGRFWRNQQRHGSSFCEELSGQKFFFFWRKVRDAHVQPDHLSCEGGADISCK